MPTPRTKQLFQKRKKPCPDLLDSLNEMLLYVFVGRKKRHRWEDVSGHSDGHLSLQRFVLLVDGVGLGFDL